jgi:hypothetical protein
MSLNPKESGTHPEAAHDIVDVLAVARSVGPHARAEAELGVGDEARPLVVLQRRAEAVPEDQAADCTVSSVTAIHARMETHQGCRYRPRRGGLRRRRKK